MRIKMKTTLAGPGKQAASPGQIVDVAEKQGRELVKGGYAEPVARVYAQKPFEFQRRKLRAGEALDLTAAEAEPLGSSIGPEPPRPAAANAAPAGETVARPEATEQYVAFLQARHYSMDGIEQAQRFIDGIEPKEIAGFVADFEQWAKQPPAEQAQSGQPSAEDLDAVENEKQAAEKTTGAPAPESHAIEPPERAVQPPAKPRQAPKRTRARTPR